MNGTPTIEKSLKRKHDHNPLITQCYGADPYALVYEGRVYIYMTGDLPYCNEIGEVQENRYSNIDTIRIISSADLVNWTDHGSVHAAGKDGACRWAHNSWAPAAAWKMIDGKPKFFLYFADSGNGIAVLSADSPTGPFTDPIGEALISRRTPSCDRVTWLFDPAVLLDEDEQGYIYFGGGIPSLDKADNPGTARVAKLSEDMIHLEAEPQVIENVPYLFEDSGINRIGDTYYYSYCSNFNVPEEHADTIGFHSGEIITMCSKNPMGPFELCGPVLKNPGYFFGLSSNNHHCMFSFKGKLYIAYHSRIAEHALGLALGYRSTGIDEVILMKDGKLFAEATRKGVAQLEYVNPFTEHPASEMAIMAGIVTCPRPADTAEDGIEQASAQPSMETKFCKKGSYIGIYGADFGTQGAEALTLTLAGNAGSRMELRIDSPEAAPAAAVMLTEERNEGANALRMEEIKLPLKQNLTSVHDLFLVAETGDMVLRTWKFS